MRDAAWMASLKDTSTSPQIAKSREGYCPNLWCNARGFARNVRAKKEFDRLPLLVLTAREQKADKYEAFLAGADDYLIKPFDPMELLFRIKSRKRQTAFVSTGSASRPARTRTMPGTAAVRLMIGEPQSPQNSRSLPGELS